MFISGWLYGPASGTQNNNVLLALANQLKGTYVPTLTGALRSLPHSFVLSFGLTPDDTGADIFGTINANPACSFYTGTDGKVGANQFDLVTLLLQQFHHGVLLPFTELTVRC